jgi:2Fe-2S ferredoxin
MRLTVIDHAGDRHDLEDSASRTVMEAIRDAGLPIAAQCGGSAACATCHVYTEESWLARLPPIGQAEADMLEFAVERTPASRLSCQIPWGSALDGLTLRLAPGSEF